MHSNAAGRTQTRARCCRTGIRQCESKRNIAAGPSARRGHLRAVAGGAQVYEYTALQLKQAVAGYGRPRKETIQHMAARLLQLDGLPGPDAADALGVAICHAHSGDALATLGNLAPAVAKKGFRTRRGRLVGPMSSPIY